MPPDAGGAGVLCAIRVPLYFCIKCIKQIDRYMIVCLSTPDAGGAGVLCAGEDHVWLRTPWPVLQRLHRPPPRVLPAREAAAGIRGKLIYVSESDILGPIDYSGDIENFVSFERAMFEVYSFKYRTKIHFVFLLFLSISPLKSICLEHLDSWTMYTTNIRAIHFYQYNWGLI